MTKIWILLIIVLGFTVPAMGDDGELNLNSKIESSIEEESSLATQVTKSIDIEEEKELFDTIDTIIEEPRENNQDQEIIHQEAKSEESQLDKQRKPSNKDILSVIVY